MGAPNSKKAVQELAVGAPNSKKAVQELAVGAPNSKKAMQELAVGAPNSKKAMQEQDTGASHFVRAVAAGDLPQKGAQAVDELTVWRSAPSRWLAVVAQIVEDMKVAICLREDLCAAVAASSGIGMYRQCVAVSRP